MRVHVCAMIGLFILAPAAGCSSGAGTSGGGGKGDAGGSTGSSTGMGGGTGGASASTTGSGGATASATGSGGGAINPNANVKLTQEVQVIDGFGVSNAWLSAPDAAVKTAVYDALFSVTKGAGLSILRNRVPFRENVKYDDKFIDKNADNTYKFAVNADGSKTFSLNWSNWDLGNTAALIGDIEAAGADYQVTTFMSTPWTPPNNPYTKWKLGDANKQLDYVNAPEQGGYLDPQHYADYADVLADYALGYKAKMGVDLTVLSLQNEPNFQISYESADWSAQQFHDFFAVLKTELTKKGVFTKLPNLAIMAPEFQNFKEDLVLPTLGDANTAAVLGIVAGHQYEFGKSNADSYTPPLLTASLNAGKRVWMTEFNTADWGNDPSIADGLILARLVHMDLTGANVSAFNYWWAWDQGSAGLVVVNGATVTVPKRLYALGQYSRFVRPGWHRVATTQSPAANVYLSAFKAKTGAQVAIVAINTGTGPASLPLTIDAGQLGEITVYRTSATEDLAKVDTLKGGPSVDVTLAPSSVTTFTAAVTP